METKNSETKISVDQLQRNIEVPLYPKRIISSVPSQTELLFDLGLEDEVVGITKFCVHPEIWFKTKTRIGGTKNINFEKIKSLQPDLIIGNKEENDERQIRQVMEEYPVWMSDIKTLEDALEMIERIGGLVNKNEKAIEIKSKIENNFSKLFHSRVTLSEVEVRTATYLIWYNPIMAAGTDTFISNMLQHCGFKNAVSHLQRYPEIDFETLQKINPDIIFLSSEPFPFKQKHVDEIKSVCPNAKVILVDGEYFSWYGSRLINAPEYFQKLIDDVSTKKNY
jgi:ABC-type Fe3+-hydroxamate transport system substrate-binding protein